jgi:splicing factor 3B subunit 4
VWSQCLELGTGKWNPFKLNKPCSRIRREQDKEATVYIGNLDERVTDSLVWELMLQAGRIVNVHLPKDRVTQTHQGYGFVEFISEEDAEYAARIMNQVRLYGKPIRVNKASADKQKSVEVGAELFVGNLDPMVTEQVLYDTFGRFGGLIAAPKVCFRSLSDGNPTNKA